MEQEINTHMICILSMFINDPRGDSYNPSKEGTEVATKLGNTYIDYVNMLMLHLTCFPPFSQLPSLLPYFYFSNDEYMQILPFQISSLPFLQQFTRTVSKMDNSRVRQTYWLVVPTRGQPLNQKPHYL